MNELISRANELWDWLHTLEPSFTFLLALPFIVVAAGFARYWFDQERSRQRAGSP